MNKNIIRTVSTTALLSTVFAGTALADSYKVQKGDNLTKIATKFKTTVKDIKEQNGLSSDLIYENQTLEIKNVAAASSTPSVQATQQATYTVVKGDALIKIANRFNVTVGELQQWNNLSSTLIYPGQVMKVSAPGKTVTVTAPAPTPAPATPTYTAPATAATGTYTVKSGDCLSKIGAQFDMSVAELKSANNLLSDLIYVGQTLKVTGGKAVSTPAPTPATTPAPAANTTTGQYVVKSGDTLSKISLQYGMTVASLKSLNGLSSDMIYVGQTLKVTGSVKEETSSAPSQQGDFSSQVVTIAKSLMGTPYAWGGSTTSGFDCSGFIYYVANQAGNTIGRYSAAGYYDRTYYVDTPKPGDLVFFENTYQKGISHVGIFLGGNQFIHADETHGIMISNLNSPYYTEHFSAFKRFY